MNTYFNAIRQAMTYSTDDDYIYYLQNQRLRSASFLNRVWHDPASHDKSLLSLIERNKARKDQEAVRFFQANGLHSYNRR